MARFVPEIGIASFPTSGTDVDVFITMKLEQFLLLLLLLFLLSGKKEDLLMRKLLSLLLVLALCIGLIPLTAVPVFATDYDLWVGDVQVTSDNASDILGDGTASYNESKNTLTLNNCAVNGEGHKDESTTNKNGVLFSAMDDLTVELVGQNALIGFNDTSGEVYHGIKAKALTIKGDGDLVATGGAANDAYSYGIYADTLTIDSSYVGTLVATGGDGSLDTNSSSAGILVDGSLEIGGGTVIATGGTTGKSYGIKINGTAYSAISGSRMYVTGGILIAQGGNGGSTANSASYGIYDAKTDNDEGLSFDGSNEGIVIARGGFVNGSTSGTRLATNLAPFLTKMNSYSNDAGTVYVPNENCGWTMEADISKVLDDLQTGNVLCINTYSTPLQLNAAEINTYGNTAFFVNFYEGGEYDDALTGLTLSAENVSISGGGKLVAIGGISTWLYQGSDPYGSSCGLQAKNMTVTSAEVIGVGGPSNHSSTGLGNESNDLCIAAGGSAKVTGVSGSISVTSNSFPDSTIGILCSWDGTMEISGTAKILGVGGSNEIGSSTGIGIGTTLSMSNGTSLLGAGGYAARASRGISAGDTTVVSGTLIGIGGRGTADSQGIYKRSNTFTVNDGAKVTALGGESAKSCGLYGATANEYCKLDVKGGDFRAAGRTYAIYAPDDEPSLVIGNGVVLKGYTDYAGTQGESDVISGTYMQDLASSGIKCIKNGAVGYDLYVGSVQVDETNASDVLGDGKVSYDPDSNTLTLNNAIITGGSENTSYYGWGICYRGSDD
ncbi:MAG: hypothetical protein IK133_10000, partial [Clostridia bacterium]|nr:hypothetical protein [Clostridia bacterium]